MHIRDPRAAGLYTVCEEEDDGEISAPTPAPHAPPAPAAKSLPRLSNAPLRPVVLTSVPPSAGIPVTVVHTPGDENEDPFALDMWSCDADSSEAKAEAGAPPTPPKNEDAKLPSPLVIPKSSKSKTSRRPPPLELATPDCPISALRYPVSPRSPASPYRSALSPIRPARVSAGSALPRTPTIPASGMLLPSLPLKIPETWDDNRRDSLSPEVLTPVTPTTPTLEGDVNLVSVLRELLTSCGEYEGFADEGVFASADDDEIQIDGNESPARVSSPIAEPRPASAPAHSTCHTLDEPPFIPVRSHSMPIPSSERSHHLPRPRSRSLLPRDCEKPYFFGHHAYLHSLSVDDVGTAPSIPVSPLDKDSSTSSVKLDLDKPLPVLEVCEPSDMDSDEEHDDEFGSTPSLPGLSYSSSSSSSIRSDSGTEWYHKNKTTTDLLGIGIGIGISLEPKGMVERDLPIMPRPDRIPPVPVIPPEYAADKAKPKKGGLRTRFLGNYSPGL